ncbi:ABC transporter ATP-binding protein [Tumebacillus algifaecis]|uniref:ABC transporter ATP-binding protein n=1 Tax=Tumebacillus algifaecis TaxID=1214604 RepID=A0A223D1S1_9BACL|nr:ABC transporter ATP-binding protein [Tumebacillus algifaecis]ASS75296.1 ABC transporter ATP-binding protein [Tumebacillus algifaecis]
MHTVEIAGLRKVYGKFHALKGIDLKLEPGLFGLLGPNGAGKTTLMQIVCTLLDFDAGQVLVHGLDLRKEGHLIRGLLGYLPQHFNLPTQFTGKEFLHYAASMKGLSDRRERQQQVERVLQEVNLQDEANKRVKGYSGGMKRRLGIAQALLGDPKLIIVDEPTAGLDPAERIRFRNLIARLSAERTILLSTHIVSDIEASCDQAAVLLRGELKFQGSLQELAAKAEGLVYEAIVPANRYEEIEKEHTIIASRKEHSDLILRILAGAPPLQGAELVKPVVEDGYMSILRGMEHV